MRWMIVFGITISLAVLTGGSMMASTAGWGLPGFLEKPVSIREGSTNGTHRSGSGGFWYFSDHRRHSGGGFQSGK